MPRGVKPRRPNVYQVAERAGVSTATVSRVLGGTGPVAPTTRDQVLQAARELNWRPSRLARALAGETHEAVGIVFPDLSGPYYAGVIAGFEQQAVDHHQAVLVLATHGRLESADMVAELADRTDGLVVMGRTIPDDVVAELAAAGVPLVLLARPPVAGAPSVRAENLRAATDLTSHLLEHGRRRLLFLGDPDVSTDAAERWEGFVHAHRNAGLGEPSVPVPCGGMDQEHGYATARELFEKGPEADALFCVNDELAGGVYRAAEERSISIPGDFAVTGWDDVGLARYLTPKLTTVRQPLRELGGRAAALLFERVDGRNPVSLVLETTPVIRASCGCPQRKGEAS